MLTWNNLSITAPTDNTNHFLRVAQLYGKDLDILAAAPTPIVDGQVSPTSPLWFIDLSEPNGNWQSPVPASVVKRQNPVAWSEDKSMILIWAETTRRSPVNRSVIIPRYYVYSIPGSTREVWIGSQQRVAYAVSDYGQVFLSGRPDDYPSNNSVSIFVSGNQSISEIDNVYSAQFDRYGRSPIYPVRFEWSDEQRMIYAGQVQDKSSTERYPAVAYDGQIKVLAKDAPRGIHGLSEDALLVRYDDHNTVWMFRDSGEDEEMDVSDYLVTYSSTQISQLAGINLTWLDTTPFPLALRHDGAIVAIAPRQPDGEAIDMSEGFVWDRLVVD